MYSTVSKYLDLVQPVEENYSNNDIQRGTLHIVRNRVGSTADPKIWGPAFWFTLHTSAAHYPLNPSPIVRERMKARILAIPYEIPCAGCRPHAIEFIQKNMDQLDDIVSNRHKLGQFYVTFHNAVNKRYNKPLWSYEQAYQYYSGEMELEYIQ